MKQILSILLCSMITVPVFANLPSMEEAKIASDKYISFREARWPGYREDKELSDFLSKSPSKYSALTQAALKNDVVAFMAVWSKLTERLRRFYATDYDFTSGRTPLHFAAGATVKARKGAPNSSVIVKALCGYVDEQNLKDYQGDNPLLTSLGVEQDNFNTAKALVEHCNADVNAVNVRGVSSLMLTAVHGNAKFFQFLVAKGADDWGKDTKGKGVYYYYNLGRVQKVFTKEQGEELSNWLELNGHDFYKEAISKCFGFSARGGARTDEIRFYSLEDTKDNMSNVFGFLVPERKIIAAIEKLEEELTLQCKETGYRSCTPVRIPKFYEKPEYIANEKTVLTGQEGYIYYGLKPFIAGIMGSASGNPEDCIVE